MIICRFYGTLGSVGNIREMGYTVFYPRREKDMLGSALVIIGSTLFTTGLVGEVSRLYKSKHIPKQPTKEEEITQEYKRLFSEMKVIDLSKCERFKCVGYTEHANYTLISFMLSDNLNVNRFIKHIEEIKQKLKFEHLDIYYKEGLMHFLSIKDNIPLPKYEYKETPEHLIPYGEDILGNTLYWNLKNVAHLLVCASTGAGKSRLINAIINHILLNNKNAMFFMCDLKRGLEFGIFENLANVKNYCEVLNDVEGLINDFEAEGERRYTLMKDRGFRDYNEYIKVYHDLPRAFLIIDEFADITRAGDKDIVTKIVELGAKLRAVGCHIVVLTQRPTADFISPSLKANMGVIGMRAKNSHNSRLIIESEKLVGLKAGTGISLLDDNETFFTAYYFDDAIINATIAGQPKQKQKKQKEQKLIK